jgi:IS5 family transposase
MARGVQMVDATIVPVPAQRNSRDENEAVKAGRIPEAWDNKPAKLRQKDRDARWTKKHGKSFFGYKNHMNADAKHAWRVFLHVGYSGVRNLRADWCTASQTPGRGFALRLLVANVLPTEVSPGPI